MSKNQYPINFGKIMMPKIAAGWPTENIVDYILSTRKVTFKELWQMWVSKDEYASVKKYFNV